MKIKCMKRVLDSVKAGKADTMNLLGYICPSHSKSTVCVFEAFQVFLSLGSLAVLQFSIFWGFTQRPLNDTEIHRPLLIRS